MSLRFKNRILLSIFTGFIIICFSIFGILQFGKSHGGHVSLLIKNSGYSTSTINIVDRIADRMAKTRKSPIVPDNKNQKKELAGLVFYILTTILVITEKSLILLLIAFIGLAFAVIKPFYEGGLELIIPPQVKFYEWWSLKFLSPIQKCMINRADEYDINPIRIDGTGTCTRRISPHFVLCKHSAGFLFANAK